MIFLKNLLSVLLLFFVVSLFAQQNDWYHFYEKSLKYNTTGMYVLGGWAIANIAAGAGGWAKSTGSSKYFHQMNLFWNTVNLTIAGIALYSNFNQDILIMTSDQMLKKHVSVEKLYLINAGLDIAYMGAGLFLKHLSANNSKRHDLLKGYGNSVLMQGAFLFVFDTFMWIVQRNHRLEFLNSLDVTLVSNETICQLGFVINI